VTDIEDAPHFCIELLLVGEIVAPPRDRLACRRIETAFTGHLGIGVAAE
jgi:hypothetical protein